MHVEADVHQIDGDQLLMFKYLSGISDKGLRTEILKLKDPTLKMVEDLITEWEAIKAFNKNADKTHNKSSAIKQASTGRGRKASNKTCLLYTSPSPRDRG